MALYIQTFSFATLPEQLIVSAVTKRVNEPIEQVYNSFVCLPSPLYVANAFAQVVGSVPGGLRTPLENEFGGAPAFPGGFQALLVLYVEVHVGQFTLTFSSTSSNAPITGCHSLTRLV